MLRWFLFRLDAERAHGLAVTWLRLVSFFKRRLPRPRVKPRGAGEVEVFGQRYANCLGLAAGFDKGYVVPEALFGLGFGFVEIGTITPRPQDGNPKPRLFRVKEHAALINRMGFNNPGADAVARKLALRRHRPGPIWLNIGKNKNTPAEQAGDDYARALTALYPYGDVFVINVSSPNTPGLRDLQAEAALAPLLATVTSTGADLARRLGVTPRPIVLKIAPDLSDDALAPLVEQVVAHGLGGIIATNTTLARPVPSPLNHEAGGFSGPALKPRATAVLAGAATAARGRLVLVGVGGVTTAADVGEKLSAGATLVQLYTSLIYGGPGHVRAILRALRGPR